MPINKITDKEDVVDTHSGILLFFGCFLLSHKKEWNLAIYSNTDGPSGYYAKWVRQWMTNTLLSRLYVESKKEQNQIHIVYRLVFARGESWRAGKMDEEGQNVVFQL